MRQWRVYYTEERGPRWSIDVMLPDTSDSMIAAAHVAGLPAATLFRWQPPAAYETGGAVEIIGGTYKGNAYSANPRNNVPDEDLPDPEDLEQATVLEVEQFGAVRRIVTDVPWDRGTKQYNSRATDRQYGRGTDPLVRQGRRG